MFSVPASVIRRVAAHASTDDYHPVLAGILFEASGVVVATNGHRLVAMHAPTIDKGITLPERDIIFPAAPLAKLARGKVATILFEPLSDGTWKATGVFGKGDPILITEIDGPFPCWRNVVATLPAPVALTVASVRPNNVAPFAIGTDDCALSFHFTGPETAVVVKDSHEPAFFGLMMPCRGADATTAEVPDWVGVAAPLTAEVLA